MEQCIDISKDLNFSDEISKIDLKYFKNIFCLFNISFQCICSLNDIGWPI